MENLGLIAGGGELPHKVVRKCQDDNIPLHIVAFQGHTDQNLVAGQNHKWFRLGAAGSILTYLKENKIKNIVIIGPVKRPSWSELRLDWVGTKMLTKIGLNSLGDDGLLSAVVKILKDEGFNVLRADDLIPDLMAPKGTLGKHKPTERDNKDVAQGLEILTTLGPLDVAQAIVIQHDIVLGVEAIEGTQALLERCKDLKRNPGKKEGVLVKMAKPGQSVHADMPTIGPDTVTQAVAANLAGIAVEAGRTQIIRRDEVISNANKAGIFLVGV